MILNLVPIGNRVSDGYFDVALIICEVADRRNTSLPGIEYLILLNFLKLKFSHKRVFVFFLCQITILNNYTDLILNATVNCPEPILLQVR